MNTTSGGPTPTDGPDASQPRPATSRRRALVAAGAGAVVAAVIVLGLVLGNSADEPQGTDARGAAVSASPSKTSEPAPRAEPSAEPSAEPTAEPEGTTSADSGEEPVPALPVVALDEPVAVEEVTASITLIEEIDGRATGPGDVAGPALRVTVRVVNETDEDVSLDGVSVNLAYGPESTPASPLDDPSRSPFTGLLPPGDAAEGVYVFRVPTDARDRVTVEVGYRAGAPLALFSGPVG